MNSAIRFCPSQNSSNAAFQSAGNCSTDCRKIGGQNATRWQIRREYSVQVQKDDTTPPQLIRDYRVGYVYIVAFDGWLLYMEMACENQFRDELEDHFKNIASSITFRSNSSAADTVKAVEGGAE